MDLSIDFGVFDRFGVSIDWIYRSIWSLSIDKYLSVDNIERLVYICVLFFCIGILKQRAHHTDLVA